MIFSVKMKSKGHQRKCGYCICGDAQVVNKSASLFFKCGTIRIKIMGPFILTTHIKMTETSLTSSWINFTRGIASKATLQQYSHSVRHYMTFLKVKDPDDLLMLDKKSIEDSLMEFIQWQKDGGVGAGLIRVRMAAIKKF
jgi:hypothetical protein